VPASGSDFAGTPVYIAPEVFAGAPRSPASDVYSVGVLLYYLSSGRYPIDGDTRSAIDRQHAQPAGRRLLHDVRPDLPDTFVQVVHRALAEDPAERYGTAGMLESALRTLLGAPIRSAPLRRRTLWLLATGVLAAGLIASLLPRASKPTHEPVSRTAITPAVESVVNASTPYEVEASIYRVDGSDHPVRLAADERVQPGDRLFLELRASVDTHVYVVNEDEVGTVRLLFPLTYGHNPLSAGQVHRLPGTRDDVEYYWQVSSPGLREHFVIFVSPTPLTAIEKSFATLPRASEDTPVTSLAISETALNTLRGVGSIATATTPRVDRPLYEQYRTPLPISSETAHGVWIRQFTLSSTP
jgi:hypothetical protein